ncbi:hypothetical protein [Streptomyces sp. NPDC047061]|uniref:hypothetical protein n=1 Tax=Streptomyces sp. NPDC047061 TaxID=3154605 RepID=UPI0033C79EDC
MTTTASTKSGLGLASGVVSELSAVLTVREGCEQQVREALGRFHARVANAPRPAIQRIGIRTMRYVVFDGGHRLMWLTSFETDWDPYIDDALELIGLRSWVDWLVQTEEFHQAFGGKDVDSVTNAEVKAFLQSAQVTAAAFFDCFGDATMPQVFKDQEVSAAFESVLEDPKAEEALSHPTLAPLLEQASA